MNREEAKLMVKRLNRKLSKLETDYDKNKLAFLKRERIFKKAGKVQKRIDKLKEEFKC